MLGQLLDPDLVLRRADKEVKLLNEEQADAQINQKNRRVMNAQVGGYPVHDSGKSTENQNPPADEKPPQRIFLMQSALSDQRRDGAKKEDRNNGTGDSKGNYLHLIRTETKVTKKYLVMLRIPGKTFDFPPNLSLI